MSTACIYIQILSYYFVTYGAAAQAYAGICTVVQFLEVQVSDASSPGPQAYRPVGYPWAKKLTPYHSTPLQCTNRGVFAP